MGCPYADEEGNCLDGGISEIFGLIHVKLYRLENKDWGLLSISKEELKRLNPRSAFNGLNV